MKALLDLRSPEVITQITMRKLYAVKIVLPLVIAGLVSCTQSEQVTEDGEHFPVKWLNDYLSDPLAIDFFEWTPPVPFDGSNFVVCQLVENGEVLKETNIFGGVNRHILADATRDKPLLIVFKLNADSYAGSPDYGERFCRFYFPWETGWSSIDVEKLPGSFVSKKGDTWIPGDFAPMDISGSDELPGTLIRFRTDPGIDPDTGEPTPVRDWSYRFVQRDASPEETPK